MSKKSVFLWGVTIFFLFSATNSWAATKVVMLSSAKNKVYEAIQDRCERALEKSIPDLEIQSFIVDDRKIKEITKDILTIYPDVILALGIPAAKLCDTLTIFPFVYTMVVNPEEANLMDSLEQSTSFSTGIKVVVNPRDQFEALQEKLPDTKVVGTLYSDPSAFLIEKAKEVVTETDLQLRAEYVDNVDDLSKKFRLLFESADVDTFWLQPDINLYNKDSLNFIIDACKLRKINFMTFYPAHLKMGATIAVTVDYPQLGVQAAEIMMRIINGESPENIPIADPAKIRTILNEKNIYRKP